MSESDDIGRWSALAEGQFFERKSAFEKPGARPRKATGIAWDIAETLSAMANADGGELVVGMEDDGEPTGVPHPPDKVRLLVQTPRERSYVQPPLRVQAREVRTAENLPLLHFAVDWSPEVHRLADGRYLLRVNDANMPFPAHEIAALKQTKAQGLLERSFPPGAGLDDLDLNLVKALFPGKAGMPALAAKELLSTYRLIEGRNGRAVPCLAALLLFGKEPSRWHPRCGVDFVRWEGTERRHGAELNVVKRVRVEHPLAVLPKKAFEAIQPHIRERQQLHDLFFTERLEYPTFVWQEAVINAIAHRDYGIQGAQTEVWMFDDHIEVRSPGLPPQPVTVEALNRREHLHVSRNPLIVRMLADLGYMRELGEGIPRMFTEMEREGFYPPRFDAIGGVSFQVTLRNQPVYDRATLEWLEHFKDAGLSGDQKRLLVYAHVHGNRFSSREYQRLAGLDLYAASNSIKELLRKDVARSTKKGGRTYEIAESAEAAVEMPAKMERLLSAFRERLEITNEDIRTLLGISRIAATRLASGFCQSGWLEQSGLGRWTRYRFTDRSLRRSRGPSVGRD